MCEAVASFDDDSTQASFEVASPAGFIAIIWECLGNVDPIAVKIDVDSAEFSRPVQVVFPRDPLC